MKAPLRVIPGNPHASRGDRLSSRDLFCLATCLTEQVQAGNIQLAQLIASRAKLNPLSIAVLASCMSRSGLSEDQILQVVA